jgi:DNA-binding response OmpR family regulator
MDVLICSTDITITHLLLQNLNKCGFVSARHAAWSACCAPAPEPVQDPDLVIADLCCPAPECWDGIENVRARFPSQPVLFLAHAWPGGDISERCSPGSVVRKPLSMQELLEAVRQIAKK